MTTTQTLYSAVELGCDKWLLACTTQAAQKPRLRSMPARDLARLNDEIAKATARFGLAADALPLGAADKDWRVRVDSTARRHAKAAAAV
jgi:hypothetical protein